ncbi:MAG TPA: hypothetical protein DCX25_01750 [Candidatus Pacebacteria bacterium]|nr:MAG: Dimethyladenosine transferase [Microgenomates group bacterium GW2011_GWB1_45_17]KKU23092.1 MAG: Dimethyladenosine transferase [Microgenomates group bacterium GW2011_GWA1_46_15]KKU23755.1 MAG: NUDIX hydrolase [Microgenomates group bacterium GW2011_GWC1_46_15]HAV15029.1 hypothetical protein [Candidatus Paceibacterota bacterium]HCR11714.1 hypothetical protein [Candidatus Paceibacterota bacterium]
MYNLNTTDDQGELFDVVDKQDRVIGQATRQQVHHDPSLIHRAVGVLVFNTKKQLLMQKRSKTKDTFPGYWVFSVGGHVHSGDTYSATVKREMIEELGTSFPLAPFKKFIEPSDGETEFWSMYVGVHNGPFPNFNNTEADEVRFFDVDELTQSSMSEKLPVPPSVKGLLPMVKELSVSKKLDALIKKYDKTG